MDNYLVISNCKDIMDNLNLLQQYINVYYVFFQFCVGRRIPIITGIARNPHLPTNERYVLL